MATLKINTKNEETAIAILEIDGEEIGRELFSIDAEIDPADWYDLAEKLACDHFFEYDIDHLICDGQVIY